MALRKRSQNLMKIFTHGYFDTVKPMELVLLLSKLRTKTYNATSDAIDTENQRGYDAIISRTINQFSNRQLTFVENLDTYVLKLSRQAEARWNGEVETKGEDYVSKKQCVPYQVLTDRLGASLVRGVARGRRRKGVARVGHAGAAGGGVSGKNATR